MRAASSVRCTAQVETLGRTGVEMEALTAVQVGLLTIYDMCKAADRGMVMGEIRVLEKHGGKSGDWVAAGRPPADARDALAEVLEANARVGGLALERRRDRGVGRRGGRARRRRTARRTRSACSLRNSFRRCAT